MFRNFFYLLNCFFSEAPFPRIEAPLDPLHSEAPVPAAAWEEESFFAAVARAAERCMGGFIEQHAFSTFAWAPCRGRTR